jgi:S-adenosylmethionine:tRNA ribosyltransferase-isomerase
MMQLADFDFHLPKNLIAQEPLLHRTASRLLVVNNGLVNEQKFSNLIEHINKGDVLVLNDTKVIKSRLFVSKDGHKIEIFLHKDLGNNLWQAFVGPAKKVAIGDIFILGPARLSAHSRLENGQMLFGLDLPGGVDVFSFFNEFGALPLPPYIKRSANSSDDERYQTVFANCQGSVAAPTAGLHFTDDILGQIRAKGATVCFVTLHVGAGTFLPVKAENIDSHKMHDEKYTVSAQVADLINQAKANGNKIIAVGTTALRALESCAFDGILHPCSSSTDIFIRPGFKFQIVQMLVTNFHLPKSTLLMLVSAFAGFENIKKAYNFAITNEFRFFSYGDANLLYQEQYK